MNNALFDLFLVLFVLMFIGITYLILKQPKKVSDHVYKTRKASRHQVTHRRRKRVIT